MDTKYPYSIAFFFFAKGGHPPAGILSETKILTKSERMIPMKRKFAILLWILSVIAMIWIGASYVDVVSHNMSTHNYQWWNVFSLLF